MSKESTLAKVSDHYDANAEEYHEQYQRENIHNLEMEYPSNYFRLQLLLNSFIKNNIKSVVEIGVGEGTPLATLNKAGIDVCGMDISKNMVEKARLQMEKLGIDKEKIIWGDIQDPLSYADIFKKGPFDGLIAMGVMPHVSNDDFVIENMSTLVKPNGRVFIEFRNKLFSLFTFNRYTYEFIMDDLLKGVSHKIKDSLGNELKKHLRMDKPPVRDKVEGSENAPGYDVILSKFHNPFEVYEMFKKHNFTNMKTHFYHYHPTIPWIEEEDERLLRQEGINLEHDNSGWRGYFLCSAFVVEAEKL
jgi:2-polyprenyl-3-methyl-5-hydroxy-6-metoxy-1,4-benzoquinol methylase